MFRSEMKNLFFCNLISLQDPDKLFIYEAKSKQELMRKTSCVVCGGIATSLDYVIELKEKHTAMLDRLLSDYEISSSMYPIEQLGDQDLKGCVSLRKS